MSNLVCEDLTFQGYVLDNGKKGWSKWIAPAVNKGSKSNRINRIPRTSEPCLIGGYIRGVKLDWIKWGNWLGGQDCYKPTVLTFNNIGQAERKHDQLIQKKRVIYDLVKARGDKI